MKIETRQKFNEIFEIKINQTNLSKIINHFYSKINHFQNIINTIDSKIKDEIYSEEYQSRIQYLICKKTDSLLLNFNDKIDDRDKEIQRIWSSFTNHKSNIQKDLYNLQQQAKVHTLKLFDINNLNELKRCEANHALELINTQLQEQKIKQNDFNNDILQKIENIQEQKQNQFTLKQEIQRLETKMIKSNYQTNEIIKQIKNDQRFMDMKGIVQKNENENSKNDENFMKKHKNLQKSRFNVRKSIDCTVSTNKNTIDDSNNFNSFQLLYQYKILKEKVQSIENKMFIIVQNQKKTQKEIERNDSENSIDCIQIPRKNMKNSRFSRVSINSNKYSQFLNDQKSYFDYNPMQIKTINDKLKKFEYKHEIIDQNYNNLLQKIHKLGNLENKVQSKLQQAEKLRVDLNTINEINSKFKKMSSLIEIQQTKYVLQKPYSKDFEAMNTKLESQFNLINKMAKKQQIKEAIIFLQNKIKQIVIILTKRFQDEKAGAINKIQNIKCLTCDKDNTHFNSGQSLRNIKTSHINRFPFDKFTKENFKKNKTIGNQ